jgi:hypothetical protein
MNNNNNNFSLIRNSEINRIIWELNTATYVKYDIDNFMKHCHAYEDEIFKYNYTQIWKRKDYEYKYCNSIINLNYKKQYCILGLDTFYNKLDVLKKLYDDKTNDFILLDNKEDSENLCNILDYNNFPEMKCYSMTDCSKDELIQYFMLLYKSCDDYTILHDKTPKKVEPIENFENSTKIDANMGGWNVIHSNF